MIVPRLFVAGGATRGRWLLVGGGASAGIDMALALAARIAVDQTARAIQRSTEYDFNRRSTAAHRARRPEEIVGLVRAAAGSPAS